MSGNATPIYATFLKRASGSPVVSETTPVASSIYVNADIRKFTGTFDFDIEYARDEATSINLRSHDFVEFWYPLGSKRQQIFAGFLEDFLWEETAAGASFKANGRDFLGQLLTLPFKVRFENYQVSLPAFVKDALKGAYFSEYAAARGLSPRMISKGAYGGPFQIVYDNSRPRASMIAEFAELALNLVYQMPSGQVELYGRAGGGPNLGPVMGTLTNAPGVSNVDDIAIRQNFSNVLSQCTVYYSSAETNLSADQLVTDPFLNRDPRVQGIIYQPDVKVFSAADLVALVGQQDPKTRMTNVAASRVRRSNQSLNEVIVSSSDPYFTAPSGKLVPFVQGQKWRIVDPEKNLNLDMVMAGISFSQDAGRTSVQLAFVEPDTLV